MKLSDIPTPDTTRLFELIGQYGVQCSETKELAPNMEFADQMKKVAAFEQRLALAVAALKSARKALCSAHYALLETAPCAAETCKQTQSEAFVSAELACRMEIKVTAETIAQIEGGK